MDSGTTPSKAIASAAVLLCIAAAMASMWPMAISPLPKDGGLLLPRYSFSYPPEFRDLAEQAGIAFSTVHRFEITGVATDTTKAKIIAAYAARRVEITNGEGTGARLRK